MRHAFWQRLDCAEGGVMAAGDACRAKEFIDAVSLPGAESLRLTGDRRVTPDGPAGGVSLEKIG